MNIIIRMSCYNALCTVHIFLSPCYHLLIVLITIAFVYSHTLCVCAKGRTNFQSEYIFASINAALIEKKIESKKENKTMWTETQI